MSNKQVVRCCPCPAPVTSDSTGWLTSNSLYLPCLFAMHSPSLLLPCLASVTRGCSLVTRHDDSAPHLFACLGCTLFKQPAVYRSIMTDVIDQIRPEFDQLGVEEAVLQELLRLWELRLAQSRAADFSQDERMAPVAKQFPMLSHEEAAEQTLVLVKQEEDAKAVSSRPTSDCATSDGPPIRRSFSSECGNSTGSSCPEPLLLPPAGSKKGGEKRSKSRQGSAKGRRRRG